MSPNVRGELFPGSSNAGLGPGCGMAVTGHAERPDPGIDVPEVKVVQLAAIRQVPVRERQGIA